MKIISMKIPSSTALIPGAKESRGDEKISKVDFGNMVESLGGDKVGLVENAAISEDSQDDLGGSSTTLPDAKKLGGDEQDTIIKVPHRQEPNRHNQTAEIRRKSSAAGHPTAYTNARLDLTKDSEENPSQKAEDRNIVISVATEEADFEASSVVQNSAPFARPISNSHSGNIAASHAIQLVGQGGQYEKGAGPMLERIYDQEVEAKDTLSEQNIEDKKKKEYFSAEGAMGEEEELRISKNTDSAQAQVLSEGRRHEFLVRQSTASTVERTSGSDPTRYVEPFGEPGSKRDSVNTNRLAGKMDRKEENSYTKTDFRGVGRGPVSGTRNRHSLIQEHRVERPDIFQTLDFIAGTSFPRPGQPQFEPTIKRQLDSIDSRVGAKIFDDEVVGEIEKSANSERRAAALNAENLKKSASYVSKHDESADSKSEVLGSNTFITDQLKSEIVIRPSVSDLPGADKFNWMGRIVLNQGSSGERFLSIDTKELRGETGAIQKGVDASKTTHQEVGGFSKEAVGAKSRMLLVDSMKSSPTAREPASLSNYSSNAEIEFDNIDGSHIGISDGDVRKSNSIFPGLGHQNGLKEFVRSRGQVRPNDKSFEGQISRANKDFPPHLEVGSSERTGSGHGLSVKRPVEGLAAPTDLDLQDFQKAMVDPRSSIVISETFDFGEISDDGAMEPVRLPQSRDRAESQDRYNNVVHGRRPFEAALRLTARAIYFERSLEVGAQPKSLVGRSIEPDFHSDPTVLRESSIVSHTGRVVEPVVSNIGQFSKKQAQQDLRLNRNSPSDDHHEMYQGTRQSGKLFQDLKDRSKYMEMVENIPPNRSYNKAIASVTVGNLTNELSEADVELPERGEPINHRLLKVDENHRPEGARERALPVIDSGVATRPSKQGGKFKNIEGFKPNFRFVEVGGYRQSGGLRENSLPSSDMNNKFGVVRHGEPIAPRVSDSLEAMPSDMGATPARTTNSLQQGSPSVMIPGVARSEVISAREMQNKVVQSEDFVRKADVGDQVPAFRRLPKENPLRHSGSQNSAFSVVPPAVTTNLEAAVDELVSEELAVSNVGPSGGHPNAAAETHRPHLAPLTQARTVNTVIDRLKPVKDGGMEIELHPAELGRVRLHVQINDSVVTLVIAADRPEIQDLFRRHVSALTEFYEDMGYDRVDVAFAGGQGAGSDQGDGDGSKTSTETSGIDLTSLDAQEEEIEPHVAGMVQDSGVDLRL